MAAADNRARRLTTVLAIDICGFSSLAEANESEALAAADALFRLFSEAVEARRGRVFHRAGDGFFAEFPSAVDGVLAATQFQAAVQEAADKTENVTKIMARGGLHLGDVIEQPDGDLLGHGVNIAARLQNEAPPGGIVTSASVVSVVQGSIDADFKKRGSLFLKNMSEPVVVYDILSGEVKKLSFLKRIKKIRPMRMGAAAGLIVLITAFAANLAVLTNMLNRDERLQELSEAQNKIAQLEGKIASLTDTISSSQPKSTDQLQLLAIRGAAKSLLTSEVPAKRRAVELVENGNIQEAAAVLQRVYEEQSAAKTSVSAQVQTLKEIGALIFYSDTQRALGIYEEIYELKPDDRITQYQLGRLKIKLGRADEARAHFVALKTASEEKSRYTVAASIGVGRSYLVLSDYAAAASELKKALNAARKYEYVELETEALAKLGTAEFYRGDMDASEKYRSSALVLHQALGNDYGVAEALNMLGTVAQEKGALTKARDYYLRAMTIREKLNDRRGLASVLNNLGQVEVMSGMHQSARKRFEYALEISTQEKLPVLYAYQLENIIELDLQNGNAAGACDNLQKARDAFLLTPQKTSDKLEALFENSTCQT